MILSFETCNTMSCVWPAVATSVAEGRAGPAEAAEARLTASVARGPTGPTTVWTKGRTNLVTTACIIRDYIPSSTQHCSIKKSPAD